MADQNKKNEFSIDTDNTRIDLGEDLLEKQIEPLLEKKIAPLEQDEMARAEILIGEKLHDDAKKILRKILIQNPDHVQARSRLEFVQNLEVRELLSSVDSRKDFGQQNSNEEATQILEGMEKDLHLQLDKGELKIIPGLFKDKEALENYKKSVMKIVLKSDPHERIDIGIAHFEMGIFEVSQAIFESVVRYEDYKLTGIYLLAISLINLGKSLEAILKIEPIVRDLTLSEVQKTDFLYLMGFAFEKMSEKAKSREFYRRVYILNPKYRDVSEKLKG